MGAEAVVEWLRNRKDELSYCIWGAIPESEARVIAAQQSNIIFDRPLPAEFNMFSSGGTTGVDDLSEICEEAMNSHEMEIQNLQLSSDQNWFVACGWSTNQERRTFFCPQMSSSSMSLREQM